ncbi:MAG: Holliday junction branch migration protein RuvA [Candidatus Saccharimonadales bacterium]|nr:Holliday junction branch migration protein RuvA [Candidatus Saccharimonadales bacterium]
MIARIKGVVVEKPAESKLIIDVSGVGYEVFVPALVSDDASLEQDMILYTYDHIRENSRDLYGFIDVASKELFELLLSVSGVGPRGALSIMNLGEATQIRKAIAGGNVAFIAGASGVGKRIAERVTVDLKDKVGVMAGQVVISDDSGDDALDALKALGYSAGQASQALSKVDNELGTQDRIKAALKEMN